MRRFRLAVFGYEQDQRMLRRIVFPTTGVALVPLSSGRPVSELLTGYGLRPMMIHQGIRARFRDHRRRVYSESAGPGLAREAVGRIGRACGIVGGR